MYRFARVLAGLVVAGLGLAGVAAAQVSEPYRMDLPGTQSFTVAGHVTRYALTRDRVLVDWTRGSFCAGSAVWRFGSSAQTKAPLACQRLTVPAARGAGEKLAATDGSRLVRVALAGRKSDRADRLVVFDRATNRRIASWPLVDRPARVALYDDIAILSNAGRHELFAIRLSDGRIAQIGITRPGDRPLIGPAGVLYQDDMRLSEHRRAFANGGKGIGTPRVSLKLVPLQTVRTELARVGGDQRGHPVQTNSITSISMDGPRVAFAVSDPKGRCDRVMFWNIPWHRVSTLSQASGPTCLPTHAPGGITDVAIAGSRAMWTTTYGNTTRLIAASIIKCVEWVVARPTSAGMHLTGLAGDGIILAYGLSAGKGASDVGIVPQAWAGWQINRAVSIVRSMSVDSDRIAVLRGNGTVSLLTRGGRLVQRIQVGSGRAIALRPGALAVLSPGTLAVYRPETGLRIRTWNVGPGATSLDMYNGIALVTAGRAVYSFDVATGRTARLFQANGPVAAALESPGAAIQYNAGGRGYLRFLPMSWIESQTR
jgi:hypothetical protein